MMNYVHYQMTQNILVFHEKKNLVNISNQTKKFCQVPYCRVIAFTSQHDVTYVTEEMKTKTDV